MKVSPHMFRKLYCTFLARNQEKGVREAQAKVCGHSTSVFQEYYDMNTKRDAQSLMQKIQNLQQCEEVVNQSDELAQASQERLNEEVERVRKINERVEQTEEDVDNHSFYHPILKEHLNSLLKTGTRMQLTFVTSHPDFNCVKRDSVGDTRLSREGWIREIAILASRDSTSGQDLRDVLVNIFRGRDELEKHKWSLRESLAERQSRAKSRGHVDPRVHLNDPLWTLLDTIHRSVRSKLIISAGKGGENDFDRCICLDPAFVAAAFNCIHCDKPVCNRCCRYSFLFLFQSSSKRIFPGFFLSCWCRGNMLLQMSDVPSSEDTG